TPSRKASPNCAPATPSITKGSAATWTLPSPERSGPTSASGKCAPANLISGTSWPYEAERAGMTDLTFLLQTILDGLVTGALIALVALGLTLVFGIARFVHVAHADLLTVAAYMTLLAEPHLGFGLAAVLGVVITVALSLLIHRTVYRRLVGGPSISLVIASLGVALALRYLVVFLWGTGQHAF